MEQENEALEDVTNKIHACDRPKRSYLVVCDNKVAQKMIQNAYEFFKNEYPELGAPVDITAKCLGICKDKVVKYKNGPTEETVSKIQRKRFKKATSDLPSMNKNEVRLVIYDLCKQNIFITLDSLLHELKEKFLYDWGRTSLGKLLKNMGFTYRKDDNRRALMEKPYVTSQRRIFLKKYMDNLQNENGKKVVVLDETWVYSNGSVRRSWQDDDVRSVRRSVGDGARYIVIHAGNVDGFIPNASLIFKASKCSEDYHSEMNAEVFEKWVQDMVLQLEEPSIIVLDNASYHSRLSEKRPTTNWRKAELQQWLQVNEIQFDVSAKKYTLLQLCRENYKEKEYAVDKIIQQAGHEVLRLPPYHCIFNPIEMVWSQAKRFYDKTILSSKKDVIGAWHKALETITREHWKHYFEHTENIIRHYWEKEKQCVETEVKPLIININENTDSSDSDFYFQT